MGWIIKLYNMEHQERTHLSEALFHNIMNNIIYIKYNDGFIDYCDHIKELVNYKAEIFTNLNNVTQTNYLLFKNTDKLEYYNLVEEVNDRFKSYVKKIYSRLDYISEIKYFSSSSTRSTQLLVLKNGYLHNLTGPAQIVGNSILYYIEGRRYEYKDWLSHPTMRYYKLDRLNKLIRKIKS